MAKELSIESIKEDKPFEYIVQHLENTFGEPKLAAKSDSLSMLISARQKYLRDFWTIYSNGFSSFILSIDTSFATAFIKRSLAETRTRVSVSFKWKMENVKTNS